MQAKKLKKSEFNEYSRWCKKYNIDPMTSKLKTKKPVGSANKFPVLNPQIQARIARQRSLPSIDSNVKGAVNTKSMMDPMQWRDEPPEVIEAIKFKATCLAPAYSKGAVQYISAGTDPSDLGRKK